MSQTDNRVRKTTMRLAAMLKSLTHTLGAVLIRHWPMKLLALLLSVGLWVGLITRDPTLQREKEFRDVHVKIMNEETLRLNGYVVTSNLEALLDDVSMRVEVPQKQYADAQASSFNVRVDLNELEPRAGEQTLTIRADSSTGSGTVTRVYPSAITVEVEEYYISDGVPINVVTTGEVPEGYYVDTFGLTQDPSKVTVSGPRSMVEAVTSAEVVLNLSELSAREGNEVKSLPFTLLNGAGEEISSEMLQVTRQSVLCDRVNVSARVYARRDVDVFSARLYMGVPADGYEVTDVYVTPSYVTVAGRSSVLDTLTLLQPSQMVNVSGATDSITATVELSAPQNLEWISATQVAVTVVIQPRQKTIRSLNVPITTLGTVDGYDVTLQQSTAMVTITGAAEWVSTLEAASVTLTCDVTGMAEGEYMDVPLHCAIDGGVGHPYIADVEPPLIRVTIVRTDAEEIEN